MTQVVAGFVSWIALSLLAIPLTGVKMVMALVSFGKALWAVGSVAIPMLLRGLAAIAAAIFVSPITWIAGAILGLGVVLVHLQERFAIFENSFVIFDKLKKVAGAALDSMKLSFEAALLKGEMFFAGIREKLAGVLKDLGADKLSDALMPDEGVAALETKLSAIATQTEAASARMKAALAEPFNFISGDDGASPVDAIKTKVAEMMAALGVGAEAEGSGMGGMFAGIVESFNGMGDSVMTKMAEMFPGLVQFWNALKGGNADPVDAKPGEEDGPMSWADRWAAALEKFKEAWASLKTSVSATVDKLMEKYKSLDAILIAGAQKSKKIAAIRRALLLKEAIMQGKAAILKAWNNPVGFPGNLPGVVITTLQTGLVIRDIMKGQAHDGMDSLPSTGTYMLEKGERVLSTRANRDLTQFLANNGQASKMRGPESVTLEVNGVADPDLVVNALASRRGELEAMIRSISAENVRLAPF